MYSSAKGDDEALLEPASNDLTISLGGTLWSVVARSWYIAILASAHLWCRRARRTERLVTVLIGPFRQHRRRSIASRSRGETLTRAIIGGDGVVMAP